MRIRHLKIRIDTDRGLFGTDISFPDGLVVLWADNSMGKSTCIRAIMIALGFEAMLTSSQQDLPLPPVMKAVVDSDDGPANVIESNVYVELQNTNGDSVVTHRMIKGSRSKDLITVTYGPALTEGTGSYLSEDFFVSRPGSASRERGFHRFLVDFLDWNLPIVPTFDGRQYPLYLQCIFPYLIVEQTRGWATLDPPIPTQFRIKEAHKRTIEFILNLDAYHIAAKRMELTELETDIENRWLVAARGIKATAASIGGVVNRLPVKPITTWPPDILPSITIPHEEKWLPIEELLSMQQIRLRELVEQEIPRVNEVTENAESELLIAQQTLHKKESVLSRLLESYDMERGEADAVADRLQKIEEDLQRNKDVQTLLSLGSYLAPNIAQQICPTCHNHISDSLIPLAEEQSTMSINDNIAFLEEQRATFRAVHRNVEGIVEARDRQIMGLREDISSLRAIIRALRQTLVSDGRLPSKAAIRNQVEIEERITRISHALEEFQNGQEELEQLSHAWADVQKDKQKLPQEDTSADDRVKITRWGELFVDQLSQYDFKSLPVESITISTDIYKATHEGWDLPTNISASDFIRVIWSYLTGLLETSREFTTNHPGLLIFDEPKQQSAKDLSFAALLRRASDAVNYGQQVIFATSEKRATLTEMLEGIPNTCYEFEGRIIQPINR